MVWGYGKDIYRTQYLHTRWEDMMGTHQEQIGMSYAEYYTQVEQTAIEAIMTYLPRTSIEHTPQVELWDFGEFSKKAAAYVHTHPESNIYMDESRFVPYMEVDPTQTRMLIFWIVAHELYHLWQRKYDQFSYTKSEELEADNFANRLTGLVETDICEIYENLAMKVFTKGAREELKETLLSSEPMNEVSNKDTSIRQKDTPAALEVVQSKIDAMEYRGGNMPRFVGTNAQKAQALRVVANVLESVQGGTETNKEIFRLYRDTLSAIVSGDTFEEEEELTDREALDQVIDVMKAEQAAVVDRVKEVVGSIDEVHSEVLQRAVELEIPKVTKGIVTQFLRKAEYWLGEAPRNLEHAIDIYIKKSTQFETQGHREYYANAIREFVLGLKEESKTQKPTPKPAKAPKATKQTKLTTADIHPAITKAIDKGKVTIDLKARKVIQRGFIENNAYKALRTFCEQKKLQYNYKRK